MAPKTNTKSAKKSEQQCGNNDNTDVCLEALFTGDPRRVETGTLTCYASRWAGLYMLWFFMLEGVFERTVKPRFAVSLGCCHYFYTKVCSRMTSGGDFYHAGTSKLISVANQ